MDQIYQIGLPCFEYLLVTLASSSEIEILSVHSDQPSTPVQTLQGLWSHDG